MKKHTHVFSKIALSAAFTSPSIQAQVAAQDFDPTTPIEIENVTVTGSRDFDGWKDVEQSNQVTSYRTGTPLKDVPQSVTVFTEKQIQQQGIDSIGDIIDYTPGVNTSQGEGHRDAVVFRGVNRSTADFFADGVRDDVQYYRGLYNVEQVEILKGPNSLTFGRGGIGGVLNRVFKKAEVGENFNKFQSSLDTFGATSSQFDFNRTLSDQAAVRLNLHYDSLENHRDLFDGDRLGINPTFTYKLGENTVVRGSYEYADHERFIDRGVPSNGNGGVATNLTGITFGDSELNFTELEAHVFRLSVDHDFNDSWRGRVNAFYGDYDKVYSNFFPSDVNDAGEVELDGYVDRTNRDRFSLSGDLVGEFSTGPVEHKLLVGAEYIRTSSDQNRFNNVFASNQDDQAFFDISNGINISNGVVRDDDGQILDTGTFSDLNDDTDVTIDVYSFFIQDEIALTSWADLIVGARFDSFDIEVVDNEPGQQGTLSRRDQEVTPRFGLVLKPTDRVSVYGTYSESFLPRSGEQFTDLGGGADSLEPDTATNLEAGIKWNIRENLGLTIAGFRIDQTTVDADTFLDIGSSVVIDSEITGLEVELKGNITDKWFISAGYSYLEGDQVGGDNDGLSLRELPANTFSLWNNYQITEDFSMGLGVIYQDESFADNENTVTLPSYVRVDLSARYDFSDDLGVQVNIENLLDRDFFPNAHTGNNITVGAPINVKFSVTGRF